MKIIFAGAGHWHYPIYRAPIETVAGCRVVGIMDPDSAVAERIAAAEDCMADTSLSRLIERTDADLAIVLGRHCDMPDYARTLIDARVPFVLEKPGGVASSDVREIAEAARAARLYTSVPLVFRSTGYMSVVRDLLQDERPFYAAFKFIAGLPDRYYETGCDWMLDRRCAGGGVLTNLGIHFIDLLNAILPSDALELTQAEFARFAGHGDVEDFASLTMRRSGAVGHVETGYLYPAPTGVFDMHFSVRTERHYVTAIGPGQIELTTLDGQQARREATTTNMAVYPDYVRQVVRQVEDGAPAIADVSDLVPLMDIIERAYALGSMATIGDERGGST